MRSMAIATQWRIQDDFKKIFAVWRQAVPHSAGLVQQTVQIAASRDLTLIVILSSRAYLADTKAAGGG